MNTVLHSFFIHIIFETSYTCGYAQIFAWLMRSFYTERVSVHRRDSPYFAKNLPRALISSRFNIPAITRQLATLWETPVRDSRFSGYAATRKMKRVVVTRRRIGRRRSRRSSRGILLYQGADFANSYFHDGCGKEGREKATRLRKITQSTKTHNRGLSLKNLYILLRLKFMMRYCLF